jgi:hypothetical protein
MTDRILDDYVTPDELAAEFKTSRRTLDRWDVHREGPPRVKVGKTILYRRAAVKHWLEARERQPRKRRAQFG